jgi:hypothetical protein
MSRPTPVKDFILSRLVPYDVYDATIADKGWTTGEMYGALVRAGLLKASNGGFRNAFAGAQLAKMRRRGEVVMQFRSRSVLRRPEMLYYLPPKP